MGVAGGHAVEEERVDVVVESLVVEEEFRQQAEVAAPDALATAVDFEKGDPVVAVDFVAGRVQQRAFAAVAPKFPLRGKVAEAELANVHHVFFGEGNGVGAKVPRLEFVAAHLHAREIAHAGDFGLVLGHGAAGAEFLNLFLAGEVVLIVRLGIGSFGDGGRILDFDEVDIFVFGLGRAFGDFGCEDGDGVGAVLAVFLPTGVGRARRFGGVVAG